MNDEELIDKYIEEQRNKAIGNPLDVFLANLAEKSGGVMTSAGYATGSPTLLRLGESARSYGDSLLPQGRELTELETMAGYGGQIAPSVAVGYATKSPVAASGVDVVSEVGTIINELQRQGYTDDEIREKLPDIIAQEGIGGLASAALGKLGMGLMSKKGLGGLSRKAFGAELYGAGVAADQPFQNLIYKQATSR